MANEDSECPQHQQIVTVWSDNMQVPCYNPYGFSVIKTDVKVLLNKVKTIIFNLSLKMSNLSILWTHVSILYYDDFYKTMYNKLGDTFS